MDKKAFIKAIENMPDDAGICEICNYIKMDS